MHSGEQSEFYSWFFIDEDNKNSELFFDKILLTNNDATKYFFKKF